MNDQIERWQLKRLDDNGNEYYMESFDSKVKAEERMTYFQNKGHKQTYFVEEVKEPPS